MFIRSENLFFRPAWPEDRAGLSRLAVSSRHDPLLVDKGAHGFVITMPGQRGTKTIGTAGFRPLLSKWEAWLWLAPSWRNLGLFGEAEDAMAELATSLPPIEGSGPFIAMEPLIAA